MTDTPGEDTATAHAVPHRDFEDFLAPGTTWVPEPEYVRVFQELTGELPMAGEAAWTQPGVTYPGFINFSRSDQPGHIRALLRTPNQTTVSVLDIPIEDFDQLMADAGLVRQAVESALTQIVEDKHRAQMDDLEPEADRSGGASAGDPLGQRDTRSEDELVRDADDAHDAKLRDLGGGTDPDNGRPLA